MWPQACILASHPGSGALSLSLGWSLPECQENLAQAQSAGLMLLNLLRQGSESGGTGKL